jgi:hypothetical protein
MSAFGGKADMVERPKVQVLALIGRKILSAGITGRINVQLGGDDLCQLL